MSIFLFFFIPVVSFSLMIAIIYTRLENTKVVRRNRTIQERRRKTFRLIHGQKK